MSEKPFHHELAIKQYTELVGMENSGNYGAYGKDFVNEKLDRLLLAADKQGIKFVGPENGPFTLIPMTTKELALTRLERLAEQAEDYGEQRMVQLLQADVALFRLALQAQEQSLAKCPYCQQWHPVGTVELCPLKSSRI